ncbi:hypothetical protein H4582DRAFT_2061436 [Lactarius indigo]|nr:hypothetical protein H4582DRAFT_2061436 [Lactarius indigo]
MSSSILVSPSSTPNFQPIFEKALEEYKKKTGKNLTAHPLAAKIQGCNSPEAILTVLQGKADELNRPRSSDDRLTKWLNPTVNILNALSATLGEGAGSVFPPTKIIFSGIGILLVNRKLLSTPQDLYQSPTESCSDGRTREDYGRSFVDPWDCDKGDKGETNKWVHLLR